MEQPRPPISDPYLAPLVKDTKTLQISTQSSSGFVLNGDKKSKVRYELKQFIDFENDPNIEYVTVAMPYAVLCNSNYTINETNNSLILQYWNGTSLATVTLTFQLGNYSVNTFIPALLSVLQPYVPTLQIRFNQLVQKLEFNHPTRNDTSFLVGSTIDYVMGFSNNFSITPSGTWVATPRCVNFMPIARFNVVCDFLDNGTILGSGSNFNTSGIIASIPNNSKLNTMVVYENTENEFVLRNLSLNTLTLSILDDNNNYVDFNGIASYFQLRFNIFRQRLPKIVPFNQLVNFASYLETSPEDFSEGLNYI